MKKIIVLILIICNLFVISTNSSLVFAKEEVSYITYTDVVEDLRKDSKFNINLYTEDINNYNLEIINLAESSNKELFIYTYQPSKDTYFVATSINISLLEQGIAYSNYNLKLVSSNGVFFKYKVEDFTIDFSLEFRIYNISSIYRSINSTIDNEYINNNYITEKAIPVGKSYQVDTSESLYSVGCFDLEIIEVTDKFCGLVRYANSSIPIFSGYCDSHFIAFNTNKPIDKLYRAKINFSVTSFRETFWHFFGKKTTKVSSYKDYEDYFIDYTEKYTHKANNIFQNSYSWDRIQTVDSFINSVNLSNVFTFPFFKDTFSVKHVINEEDLKILKQNTWVLSYYETDYSSNRGEFETISKYSVVNDITILELFFETDGIVYNLGVVDNKTNESSTPINKDGGNNKLLLLSLFIILFVVLVVVFIIMSIYCPVVLNAILGFIKTIFVAIGKGVVWLLKGLVNLFKKIFKKE